MRACPRWCRDAAVFVSVFLFLVATTGWSAENDLNEPLAAIRAVGEKGAGNRQAKDAWQVLAKFPTARLTDVLAGMDGANPIAANYLRAVVEAIAERELNAGGKLPADKLEAFALDSKHDPRK